MHEHVGQLLCGSISRLGGLWVKLATYLLECSGVPAPITERISHIRHQPRPQPLSELTAAILTRQPGAEALDSIASICEVPLCTASISQVYAGRLHTGEPVVIKLQHRGLRSSTMQDAWLARCIATALARIHHSFDYTVFVNELCEEHTKEVDYLLEASHLHEVRANLAKAACCAALPEVPAASPRPHAHGRVHIYACMHMV